MEVCDLCEVKTTDFIATEETVVCRECAAEKEAANESTYED